MTAVSLLRGVLAIGVLSLLGLALTAPWALSQFPLLLAGLSTASRIARKSLPVDMMRGRPSKGNGGSSG